MPHGERGKVTGEAVEGLKEKKVATKGDTLELDNLRALLDTWEGGNEEVSKAVHLGLISELRFKIEALERGFEVYDPVSPVSKVDFIVRKAPNRPLLVQVKRAHLCASGGWRFLTCALRPKKGAVHYTVEDFDVYAVHIDDGKSHSFGFWPVAKLHGRQTLTWHPIRNSPPADNWDVLQQKENGNL